MLELVKAEYKNGYKIWIELSNGKSGTVDFSALLWGDMFEPLKDINNFKNFQLSEVFGTIVWANGADVAPEYLLNNLVA